MSATTYMYLNDEGEAKLVFSKDFSSFDGVLINKHDDTLVLQGKLIEGGQNLSCDITVTDHENDCQYLLNNVAVILENYQPGGGTDFLSLDHETAGDISSTPRSSSTSSASSLSSTAPVTFSADAGEPNLADARPTVRLQSESVCFETNRVLVGNRADKEISRYLNRALTGRGLTVCTGPMRLNTCIRASPHHPFTARRMSKEFVEQIDQSHHSDYLR